MKRLIVVVVLIWCLPVFAYGQDAAKALDHELWRTRADVVTSVLLKDASKKDVLDRALLTAQLADLWWEANQTQANLWFGKAIDAISFYPAEERRVDKERFLRTARGVLNLVSTRNKKHASRLLEILTDTENLPDKEKDLNAEALIDEALRIIKTDPRKAAELGILALRFGFPANADRLSLELRRSNPQLADRFFEAAFLNVSALPDRTKLYLMEFIAFPENITFPVDNAARFPAHLKPPIRLRILFLNFVAEYLSQSQLRFSSRAIPSCSDQATFTIRLARYFVELLPEKSSIVQNAVNICLGDQTQRIQQLVSTTSASGDVEELLKQADAAQDNNLLRANYLIKAASAAYRQKKFLESIQILEKMTDDEKKVNVEYWEDLRLGSGAGLAVAQFKSGDVTAASRTIEEIPDALQPLAAITFVSQFSSEDVISYQFCVNLLNDARRGIVKPGLRFTRKSYYWFILVKLYSNYRLQREAAAVFREIAIAFNDSRSDDAPARNVELSNQLIADSQKNIPGFSANLLETEQGSILESVGLLKDETARIQINLAFLKIILRKSASGNEAGRT